VTLLQVMKMNRAVPCVSVFLVFCIALQGCDFGEPPEKAEKQEVESDTPTKIEKPPPRRKKLAKCHGGHFHCDGGWREWCARMEKQCKPKDCAPMCAWTCDSPACNQECGPVCNQPACSTRCKGFNTDSCKMKCGKPMCKVVCPKHFCPSEDCAACKTECGKPACKMECGVDEQPCRNVCAQPVCKWECKNPSLCPKPKCAMKCKKAPDCMQKTHMFSKVPPLEPGETEIVTFDQANSPAPAPASLFQLHAATNKHSKMRVNFTSMGYDQVLRNGEVDLALVQVDATDEVEAQSWVREVDEVSGEEKEASCNKGRFHCQGDDVWCADQRRVVCKGVETTFLQQRSHSQSHLHA